MLDVTQRFQRVFTWEAAPCDFILAPDLADDPRWHVFFAIVSRLLCRSRFRSLSCWPDVHALASMQPVKIRKQPSGDHY